MKVDFHAANCGPVCKCGEGVLGRQSLEELEFTRSACAAAMNGQVDKLEQLQTHNNEEVYKKAVHILETYFGLDDDEDEQIAPEANQQGFVFQGQQPAGPPGGYQFG